MTPAEAAQAALAVRAEDSRRNYERLAEERRGMTADASVIRWDDPDRKPWVA